MKLKFERFEGLACFSVRGAILPADLRILEFGLESLVPGLEETLLINLNLAEVAESAQPELIVFKKHLSKSSKIKIHWVSSVKGLGDFPTVVLFTSRLVGYKTRHIGERIKLEDEVFALQEQLRILDAQISELGGDEERSHKIILENRILNAEVKILEETLQFQLHRAKLQNKIESEDADAPAKTEIALEEVRKYYAQRVPL